MEHTYKYKKYLFISIIIALLVLSYAMVSFVRSYGDSVDPTFSRSFSVSAEGKIVAVPDVAKFSFQVITQGGTNLSDLQEESIRKANRAIDFLTENNVSTEDIKTQQYSVSPRYQYFNCGPRPLPQDSGNGATPCPPPEIVGYTITQGVQVTIRDFTAAGELLSGVVENGANSVSQLQFTIDDPTEVENEARAEAIKKARKKAQAVAEAGGFRLGRLLSIQEGGNVFPQRYDDVVSFTAESSGDGAAPRIEPGSQDVLVTVTLKYEIK